MIVLLYKQYHSNERLLYYQYPILQSCLQEKLSASGFSWLEVVEQTYCICSQKSQLPPPNAAATAALQHLDQNWTLDHDEDLAHFLCSHIETQNDSLGSIKNYVESIQVSSFSVSIHLV